MAHSLPDGDCESILVKELTTKLEQLQGLLDSSIGSDLAEQLMLLQQRQSQPSLHGRHRSASLDVVSPSTSSSSSTGPSFPSSPLNTHNDYSISPSFSALQSENEQLRLRLEASENERERANREVAELKRKLGMIQLDELEELDLAGAGGRRGSSGPSRERSNSRGGGTSGWSSSNGMNGIRIPGAGGSSFSPPSSFAAARQGQRASSSLSSARGFYAQSRASSSINTTLTTPSSSYPVTFPPPTSPASSFGGASVYSGSRAPPPSIGSGSFRSATSSNGGRLDFEDLTPSRRSYAEAEEGEADREDGGLTPLSTSPGSRSGSVSRRTSFSVPCGAVTSAKLAPPNEVVNG